MSRFWSKTVQGLTPYVPGEQPKLSQLIKLNTNESPYGPSPKALKAIQDAVNDSLRLYPDPNSEALKQSIATVHKVNPNQVFVGNGSDEVLAHAFLGLLKKDAPILFRFVAIVFAPLRQGEYSLNDFTHLVNNYFPKPPT